MSTRVKIAVVGGGVYAPRLCEVLARTAGLPAIDLWLTARRAARLLPVARDAQLRVRRIRADWSVIGCPRLAIAAENAHIVILLVRVGGLGARAYDEEFPRWFGVVGDEGLGPGGMANAWRTVPVFAEIARTIKGRAPEARVLNLTAPLGITTRVLLNEGVDAYGLCELPTVSRARLAGAVGIDPDALQYGGLNHLGWFWCRHSRADGCLEGAIDAGLTDRTTLERFGAVPLHYYFEVFDPSAAARLGLRRKQGRARTLLALAERAWVRIAAAPGADGTGIDARPTPWFEIAIAPVVRALIDGSRCETYANVANRAALSGIDSNAVVEIGGAFDGREWTPFPLARPPRPVASFLSAASRSEGFVYEAALSRNPRLIASALRALPVEVRESSVHELADAICCEDRGAGLGQRVNGW